MADDAFVLEIPEMVGIALSPDRKPQAGAHAWPEGTVIVSADSHMLEPDCWVDRFPEHLKAEAPRIEFRDGGYQLSINGKAMTPPHVAAGLCTSLECTPGMTDITARLADLDIEGVEKELIFPQRLFGLFMFGKMMNRPETFAAYNEHIAEACAAGQGRLFPVMVPNYWDPALAAQSVARCKELGARCLMVPIKPGDDVDGEPIQYSNPKLDPLYAAIAESGIPLCFHIGEAIPTAAPGAAGTFVLTQMQGFRHIWAQLTFGGVFDRFPALRVVFVEGGICWVASMLHDADMIYNSFPTVMNPKLAHPPSWYWFNHCYATFMTDPAGLELLHRIGADRVMWSSDYPHQESTFGYTRSAIQAVFDATTVENAQKIFGKTALEVFRM
ncbi:MAG TPA: amidohydrolase family protein [Caulobacteraceae bacterium]|jgi:predicted TIM-barrel fold metal-dependent hydrolase|nr:amidohydrolase family protein [Caulobacteraceae bacterium]